MQLPLEPNINDAGVFETLRPRLIRIAYRMVGTHAEAEDIVQDAWLRWSAADRATIREPQGWLTRVVSRLALDHLKSARVRRETYPGTWLPEPLVEDEEDRSDDITLTLMLALDRLSPLERRDVRGFGWPGGGWMLWCACRMSWPAACCTSASVGVSRCPMI